MKVISKKRPEYEKKIWRMPPPCSCKTFCSSHSEQVHAYWMPVVRTSSAVAAPILLTRLGSLHNNAIGRNMRTSFNFISNLQQRLAMRRKKKRTTDAVLTWWLRARRCGGRWWRRSLSDMVTHNTDDALRCMNRLQRLPHVMLHQRYHV
jgi:hypothetical protein